MTEDYEQMFQEETREHINSMNENLLTLEEDPQDEDAIEEVYRSSHTLKGMAATMGYKGIEKISHRMEELFDIIKKGEASVNEALFDILFECVDSIELLSSGEETDVEYLVEKLDSVIEVRSQPEKKVSMVERELPEEVGKTLKEIEEEEVRLFIIKVSEEQRLPSLRGLELKEKIDFDHHLFYPDPDEVETDQDVFYLITSTEVDKEDVEKTSMIDIDMMEGRPKEILGGGVSLEGEKTEEESVNKESEGFEGPVEEEVEEKTVEERKTEEEVEEKTEEDSEEGSEESEGEKKPKKKSSRKKDTIKTSDKIKVDLDEIEHVMNLISELVIAKGSLEDMATKIESQRFSSLTKRVDRITGELRGSVLDMKMTEVRTVFRRFPRMVRDIAKENDKEVDFEMEGEDIELDRTVLERITDPLVHLLRNAIDHGIEPVEERKEKGKPKTGKIELSATQREENAVIEISDDGRGIDPEKIKQKCIEKGLLTEEEAEELDQEELYRFIFSPHFTTQEEVTKVSGRGVGLDVVKKTMDALGGDVRVHSTLGEGTTFQLTLPPSVSIVSAFLVGVGEGTYAIPLEDVVETTKVDKEQIEDIGGSDFVRIRDEYLPLVYLKEEFENEDVDAETLKVVVVNKEDKVAGLVIDEVKDEKEVVIKPLPKKLQGLGGFMGATILGDGTIAMIIDSLHWIESTS